MDDLAFVAVAIALFALSGTVRTRVHLTGESSSPRDGASGGRA